MLNKVLNNQEGYKVAVIVNDIGEVNVDAKLIADGAKITDTSDIVPLTNGCICCTLKSALAQNIENLIKTGKYDYIMIEASGVCEPMPIAQELELIKNGKLDNVVGVVDAARLVDEFAGGDKLLAKDKIGEEDIESLLVQQIEFCSTLVINKKDLVTEDQFKKVRKVIEVLLQEASILRVSMLVQAGANSLKKAKLTMMTRTNTNITMITTTRNTERKVMSVTSTVNTTMTMTMMMMTITKDTTTTIITTSTNMTETAVPMKTSTELEHSFTTAVSRLTARSSMNLLQSGHATLSVQRA